MEDKAIVDLFFARSETAIEETQKKYGRYCHAIAKGILSSEEDAKECVSDAYVGAWNSIPPQNPENLATYLGKLTRNASLDRLRERKAKKRGENSPCVSLDELAECIPSEGRGYDPARCRKLFSALAPERNTNHLHAEILVFSLRRRYSARARNHFRRSFHDALADKKKATRIS